VGTNDGRITTPNASAKTYIGNVSLVGDLTEYLRWYAQEACVDGLFSKVNEEADRLSKKVAGSMQGAYPLPEAYRWIYTDIAEGVYWNNIHGLYTPPNGFSSSYISEFADLSYLVEKAVDWTKVRYEDIFKGDVAEDEYNEELSHGERMAYKLTHMLLAGGIDCEKLGRKQKAFKEAFISNLQHNEHQRSLEYYLALGYEDGKLCVFDTKAYNKHEGEVIHTAIELTMHLVDFVLGDMLTKPGLERLKASSDSEDALLRIGECIKPPGPYASLLELAFEYARSSGSLSRLIYDVIKGFKEEHAAKVLHFKSAMRYSSSRSDLTLNINFGFSGNSDYTYINSVITNDSYEDSSSDIVKLRHELLECILGKDYEIPIETTNGIYTFKNLAHTSRCKNVSWMINAKNKDEGSDALSCYGIPENLPYNGFVSFLSAM
jgi:hypothetical protein